MNNKNSTTHIAYSDESNYNKGRYRGISIVSMPAEKAAEITSRIKTELRELDVSEVKWSKIKGAKNRYAAMKVIDICVKEATENRIRVDILIWDMEDERHRNLEGRDDHANFRNMYIQLLKNVMRKRWTMDATWQFFPDENSVLDWEYIKHTLAKTDRFTNRKSNLFADEWRDMRCHFNIAEVAEVSSAETSLVQIADIFAGMGVFSYEHHAIYTKWERLNSHQMEMFPPKSVNFSNKEKEHSWVLHHFLKNASKNRLSVSNKEGLRTYNPSNPINFWLYQPQRKSDKAPLRS